MITSTRILSSASKMHRNEPGRQNLEMQSSCQHDWPSTQSYVLTSSRLRRRESLTAGLSADGVVIAVFTVPQHRKAREHTYIQYTTWHELRQQYFILNTTQSWHTIFIFHMAHTTEPGSHNWANKPGSLSWTNITLEQWLRAVFS